MPLNTAHLLDVLTVLMAHVKTQLRGRHGQQLVHQRAGFAVVHQSHANPLPQVSNRHITLCQTQQILNHQFVCFAQQARP